MCERLHLLLYGGAHSLGKVIAVVCHEYSHGFGERDSVSREEKGILLFQQVFLFERLEIFLDDGEACRLVTFLHVVQCPSIDKSWCALAFGVAFAHSLDAHLGVESGLYLCHEALGIHESRNLQLLLSLGIEHVERGICADSIVFGIFLSLLLSIELDAYEAFVHVVAEVFLREDIGSHPLAWSAPVCVEIHEDEFLLFLCRGESLIEADVSEVCLCISNYLAAQSDCNHR